MVDVIVTITGGGEAGRRTGSAVRAGGGLVGVDSTVTPPDGVEIDFVDWPFLKESKSVDAHLAAVREHQPKYAVAPDVRGDRSLDEVVSIAEQLAMHARFVIVVPVTIPVAEVPSHFIAGVPFRDEWDTDIGINEYPDFRGRPVHILGGNMTEQIELADRFQYHVVSVDSPNILAWADGGRVWVARLGGADSVRRLIVDDYLDRGDPDSGESFIRGRLLDVEGVPDEAREDTLNQLLDRPAIKDLSPDEFIQTVDAQFLEDERAAAAAATGAPTYKRLLSSRYARVQYSVQNIVQAWHEGRTVTRLSEVAPGRGPPPPAPEGLHGRGREAALERFLEATVEEEMGSVDTTRGLDTFEE